jgi:hypothetical protein
MQTKPLIDRHLDEAETALADLDKQRDVLIAEIAALRAVRDNRPVNGADVAPQERRDEPPEAGTPRYGSKRYRYEKAIEELLIEYGTMHRIHLHVHMKNKGVIGDERDPLANISNILSTSPKFVPVGSGIWGLASEMDEEEVSTVQPETKTAG